MASLTTPGRAIWETFFFKGCAAERLGLTRSVLGAGLLPFHALQFVYLANLSLDGARFFLSEPIWYFRVVGGDLLIGSVSSALHP